MSFLNGLLEHILTRESLRDTFICRFFLLVLQNIRERIIYFFCENITHQSEIYPILKYLIGIISLLGLLYLKNEHLILFY